MNIKKALAQHLGVEIGQEFKLKNKDYIVYKITLENGLLNSCAIEPRFWVYDESTFNEAIKLEVE